LHITDAKAIAKRLRKALRSPQEPLEDVREYQHSNKALKWLTRPLRSITMAERIGEAIHHFINEIVFPCLPFALWCYFVYLLIFVYENPYTH
jgi:hypothetical protein